MSDLIERSKVAYDHWGFKDPRTCLTYPIWFKALPNHKVIVVFRHYRELMRRYKTENSTPRLFRVLHAWTHYNLCNLHIIQQAAVPTFVVRFEALMQYDEVFHQMEHFVSMPLSDQRNPALYRNRVPDTTPLQLPTWITKRLPTDPEALYQALSSYTNSLD